MKTYAADVYVELPGNWNDDSTHVYRDFDDDGVEVRIERSPVTPEASALSRIVIIEERLKMLDPKIELIREQTSIGGREACTLITGLKRDGDQEKSLMFVAAFKSQSETAVTVTVTANAGQKKRFDAVCKAVVQNCRVVEVR